VKKYVAAFVFSVVPGLTAFVLLAALGLDQLLAGIVGGALTGFGLDVCLNSSEPVGAERKAP
jgi:hypothetical protein